MKAAAVDRKVLDQLHVALGRDTTVLRQVIDNYLAGLDSRIATLRTSCDDPSRLGRAAHALASPSATLGVRSIAEPCLAIERAVDEGNISSVDVTELVRFVERAVEPARAALGDWLAATVASA